MFGLWALREGGPLLIDELAAQRDCLSYQGLLPSEKYCQIPCAH